MKWAVALDDTSKAADFTFKTLERMQESNFLFGKGSYIRVWKDNCNLIMGINMKWPHWYFRPITFASAVILVGLVFGVIAYKTAIVISAFEIAPLWMYPMLKAGLKKSGYKGKVKILLSNKVKKRINEVAA